MGSPQLPVANLLLDVFEAADKNKDGTLDRTEFANMLRSGVTGLTEKQIRRMLAECDQNEDGVIQYREFVPMMLDQITAAASVEDSMAESQLKKDLTQGLVEITMIYGVSRAELEAELLKLFQAADKSKTGKLSRSEFRACLKELDLGLSKKDINLLMAYADADHDNEVSYTEFVPLAFGLVADRVSDYMLASATLNSNDALVSEIVGRFAAADTHKSAELAPRVVKAILKQLSEEVYPMSTYQLHALMEVAPYTSTHKIEYITFAPIVASTIYGMFTAGQYAQKLFEALRSASDDPALVAMSKLEGEKARALLADAFQHADKDKTGALESKQLRDALAAVTKEAVGSEPQLAPFVWGAMMATVDARDESSVPWERVVDLLCNVFAYIGRERAIEERTQQGKMPKTATVEASKGEGAATLSAETLAAVENKDVAGLSANQMDAPEPAVS